MKEIGHAIIQDYIHFLKVQKDLQENTVIRYMKVVKKITNMALANDWMEKDPFFNIRIITQKHLVINVWIIFLKFLDNIRQPMCCYAGKCTDTDQS